MEPMHHDGNDYGDGDDDDHGDDNDVEQDDDSGHGAEVRLVT